MEKNTSDVGKLSQEKIQEFTRYTHDQLLKSGGEGLHTAVYLAMDYAFCRGVEFGSSINARKRKKK